MLTATEPTTAPGADKYLAIHGDGWMMHDRFLEKREIVSRILSREYEGCEKVIYVNVGDRNAFDASAIVADEVLDAWRASEGNRPLPEHIICFCEVALPGFDTFGELERTSAWNEAAE